MSSNAGVRRNRRPRGAVMIDRKVTFSEPTYAAVAAACKAVDPEHPLSTSLYLEQLLGQLIDEHGALPVFSPTLDGSEVQTTAAA